MRIVANIKLYHSIDFDRQLLHSVWNIYITFNLDEHIILLAHNMQERGTHAAAAYV